MKIWFFKWTVKPNMSLFSIRDDLGFRWVSEQVSHHPPVSAFQAEGLKEDFIFHGSIYPKVKFWGKSIEAEPKGIITLELPKWVHRLRLLCLLCFLASSYYFGTFCFFVSAGITRPTPGQTPPVVSTISLSVSFGLSSTAAWKWSTTSN